MAWLKGVPLPSNPNENAGAQILGATFVVTILAFLTCIARFWVRLVVVRNFGWDDGLVAFAMALSIVGQGMLVGQVQNGLGRHLGDLTSTEFGMAMKLGFINQLLYMLNICVIKLAVGASLLRIASTKLYKTLIIAIMGFVVFYTISYDFTLIFECTDVRTQWDPSVPATCWSFKTILALSYTNIALNITTDILFAVVIPACMLWGLNMNRRTKISLLAVLGLGVFVCVAAIVRLGYQAHYVATGDWLWDSQYAWTWLPVECNMGILAASLPTLKPVLRRVLGSTYGSGSRKTSRANQYHGGTTRKSGSHWTSLGGRRDPVTDETSSERAFNRGGPQTYELDDVSNPSSQPPKNPMSVEVSSNESSDEITAVPATHSSANNSKGEPPGVIRKTTTTMITFLDH